MPINTTDAINATLPQESDDFSISLQELPLLVVITVKINKKVYTALCIKKVIFDFDRKSHDCYPGVTCHGCNLRDFKEPIKSRPLGALETVFNTLATRDKLTFFEWGVLEYYMSASKTSFAVYAPLETDLTRQIYDDCIATECVNHYHALTKFRQVIFRFWERGTGIKKHINCWALSTTSNF